MPSSSDDGKDGSALFMDDGVYPIVHATPRETFGPVCMTPDGRYLACVMVPEPASEDGEKCGGDLTFRFKVLSMERQKAVKTIECTVSGEGNHKIVALEMSAGPKYLVSGHCIKTDDGTAGDINIWDLQTGACRDTLSLEGGGGAYLLHVSRDGRYIAAVAGCKSAKEGGATVQVWELRSGSLVQTIECVSLSPFPLAGDDKHAALVTGVALADGGETVVTGSRDGSVKIWDRASGQFRQTVGKPKTLSHAGDFFGLFAVDTSPDDRWMVCGGLMAEHEDHEDDSPSRHHHLYYLGLDMGARLSSVRSQSEGRIRGVSISEDGRVCVVWRQEGEHWASRIHRLTKAPGITGSGSEATLGIQGPVEDEIACSEDEVHGVSRVAKALRPGQYYIAYSTDDKIVLSVFSYCPVGSLK